MPVIRITILFLICSLFMGANSVRAVTPQIRLPDWHSTSFALAEWNADEGILMLSVTIKADQVNLSSISSQLHAPAELGLPADRHERSALEAGDKVVFMHKVNARIGFSGWLELDVRAMPNREELSKLAAEKHKNEPLTRQIVEEEIRTIENPIYIGTSLPVLLREDAALSTMPEAAFVATSDKAGRTWYFWYPPEAMGKGITGEGLKAYAAALRANSLERSESAAKMLLRRFDTNKDELRIDKSKSESFSMPSEIATSLIKANQLTLRARNARNPQIISRELSAMKPGYTRPFLYYNLAVLENSLKNHDNAVKHLEHAIKDLPAWPLAKKLLKKLKKQGEAK